MEFNNTTNESGLIQDISFWTGVDLNEYTLKERTRQINQWYLTVVSWIFEADGRWQWDDANQTTRPCATANLVSGQQSYRVLRAIPSSSQDWLQVSRVEILDSNDNGIKLFPIDEKDIVGRDLNEFMNTNGIPQYYDFSGNSIFLYPATNYNKSNSLQIYFKRAPLKFNSTDTTKQPGFASIYHKILSLGASYDFALAKNLDNRDILRQEITVLKKGLKDFYSNRDKYEKTQLTRLKRNYK